LPEIARELGVDAVLEGTVLRSGEKVRITAQLIDAVTDRHLWAGTYERDLADVLALQMEVAREVAEEIRVVLSPQEERRLGQSRPVDPEAYEAYLRGRFHWNTRSAEGFDAAIREFQRAIAIDPGYARAYAGLADCYVLLVEWRRRPAPEGTALARAAAERALALDSTLAEGYTSLAEARVIAWDWEGAEQAFRRALALNPGYATAHQWYGFFLSKMGRHDGAVAELRRALELDPLSLIIRTEFARVYYHARRYDDALAMIEGVRALDSTFADVNWMLGSIYVELPGRAAEAAERFRASEFDAHFERARALILAGRPAEGQAILDSVLAAYAGGAPNPRYAAAAEVYAALGEPDRAFAMLERAYARGVDEHLTYLKVRPPFDPLRDDPRFQDLLRRLRLPG
jgi:tetratricopeptide (TPR) repeat protein